MCRRCPACCAGLMACARICDLAELNLSTRLLAGQHLPSAFVGVLPTQNLSGRPSQRCQLVMAACSFLSWLSVFASFRSSYCLELKRPRLVEGPCFPGPCTSFPDVTDGLLTYIVYKRQLRCRRCRGSRSEYLNDLSLGEPRLRLRRAGHGQLGAGYKRFWSTFCFKGKRHNSFWNIRQFQHFSSHEALRH